MQGKRTANRRAAALRQALMLSISSMLVCAMMLVGMTYAWFTDSAVTAVNAIHTGNLDANLMTYTPGNSASATRVHQNTAVFDTAKEWKAGSIEIHYIMVQNNGRLPIRYSLGLNATPKDSPVLSQFRYAFVSLPDSTSKVTEDQAKSAFSTVTTQSEENTLVINYHTLSDSYGSIATATGSLAVTATDGDKTVAYYALILYYPGESIQVTSSPTQIQLGLRLLAIQKNHTDSYIELTTDGSEAADSNPWNTATGTSYSNPNGETTTPETSNSSETSEN